MENQSTKSQIFKYSLALLSLIMLFACQLPSTSLQAQTYSSQDKKAIKLFEEARMAYREMRLSDARELLEEIIDRDANFIEAQSLLAFVCVDAGDYEAAEENFKKAVEIDKFASMPNNLFFLAQMVINDGRYEEAKGYFERYLNADGKSERMNDESYRQLEKIDFALTAIANPVPFEPVNLGAAINSERAEYFPSLTVDEKNHTLYEKATQFKCS